jgi:Cu/Ag efflux protein CusF
MEGTNFAQYAAIVAALSVTAVTLYALIRFHPTPKFHFAYALIALLLFAVGTGSKVDLSYGIGDSKLQVKIAELEENIRQQNQQIATLTRADDLIASKVAAIPAAIDMAVSKHSDTVTASGDSELTGLIELVAEVAARRAAAEETASKVAEQKSAPDNSRSYVGEAVGKVLAVTENTLVLEDGTTFTIGEGVSMEGLEPGTEVTVSYEEQDGQPILTEAEPSN